MCGEICPGDIMFVMTSQENASKESEIAREFRKVTREMEAILEKRRARREKQARKLDKRASPPSSSN